MVKKEIKALMIEPGKHPVVTVLNGDLDSLQKAVCVRRFTKSSRPAKLSSDSAQIEQWDRPD